MAHDLAGDGAAGENAIWFSVRTILASSRVAPTERNRLFGVRQSTVKRRAEGEL